MIFTMDPKVPWVAEMLSRPILLGASSIEVNAADLPLIAVGQMVDRTVKGGWASLGRFWRPSVQYRIETLVRERGAANVTPNLIRSVLPKEEPPSKFLPYRYKGDEVWFLPLRHEDRIVAMVEEMVDGGWCGWTPWHRMMFIEGLLGFLETNEPDDVTFEVVSWIIAGVEQLENMKAGGS